MKMMIIVRFGCWKSTVSGMLTLIKSVLGSLPLYFFSLFWPPSNVLKKLESIRSRDFLGTQEGMKISWVGWENFLVDPRKGGLGVGKYYMDE